MKLLTQALILAGAVIAGWVGREYVEQPADPLELEIAANQEICADETQPGYASYPVTHWGELRGCLRVRVDSPEWLSSRSVFVRKIKQ